MLTPDTFERSVVATAMLAPDGTVQNRNGAFIALTENATLESISDSRIVAYGDLPETGSYCLARNDGSRIPVLIHRTPLDADSSLLRLYNLADAEQTFRTVDESARRLSTLIETMREGVLVEDETHRVVVVNSELLRMLKVEMATESVIGVDLADAVGEVQHLFANPDSFVDRSREITAARVPVEEDIFELVDGRTISRDYIPVQANSQDLGHLWVYRDVTRQQQTIRELQEQALTDPLTQVANRRLFTVRLQLELERLVRKPDTLTLLLLDIDHFKKFNDNYGHQVGDEVLKTVTEILIRQTRAIDLVARYGGEEFVVILPGADRATGQVVAERCRAAIESHPWEHETVTASFGAASISDSAITEDLKPVMEKLIARADNALYASKNSGRNRVTCFVE